MTNPATHAFFLGRALANALSEKLEDTLSNTLSEIGKFDAEARENLHQFTQELIDRAEKEMGNPPSWSTNTTGEPDDLQKTIDDLRAEIAELKSELKNYSHSH